MSLFQVGNELEMEPGEVILRQLKAKFPPKKGSKNKDGKKVKKLKKKSTKKVKVIVPDEDLGLESSGSSSSPSSLTLTSSRDSGHASDSNSASRDSEDTNEDRKELEMEGEKKPIVKLSSKLNSSRVAFFENAIKTAAVTVVSRKDQSEAPTRGQKEADFLRAVESPPAKAETSSPISHRRCSAEYSDTLSSDDTEEPLDPAVEEPKFGTLFLSERDLKMEKKLIKQVASEIEENGVGGVKKILRKKMNKWKSESINVAIMGDSLSGKSSVIKALGGMLTQTPNKFTGRMASCHQPTESKSSLNDSLSLWELPAISMSGKYSKINYLKSVEAQKFDLFLICTPTWFKGHQIAVAQQIINELNVKVIFVRTKLDDSIISDRKSRPSSHDEDVVSCKVRNHCWEPLEKSELTDIQLFLISAFHLNRYDGPKLLSCLLNKMDLKVKRNFSIQDAMTMSLPALSLEIISRKREMLSERIWKISAISTVSGIMPIGGYNLTADIELLQKELRLYRNQLGVSDQVLEDSSNCPNMVQVWNLCCEGNGLQSLLRQSAMDQQWEEFSKFMNKLPLIGGNVSFAATCSVLKYCLSELCAISIRYNELEIRKML